jgi:phosphoserine phosphatase RsbU/P
LIADVSGKGLGAALLTTLLRGALLGLTAGADACAIFGNLNRFLYQHSELDRYATLFFGIVDRDGGLDYINAGHPSPFLLRREEVSRPFTEGSVPVGLLPDAEYTVAHFQLRAGRYHGFVQRWRYGGHGRGGADVRNGEAQRGIIRPAGR